MTSLIVADQIAALRSVVFGATAAWNSSHPHRLRTRQERASVQIAHVYGDVGGSPSYAVTVECTLAATAPLNFHGIDLATVVEHARLTLEAKIETELRRRADIAGDGVEPLGRHHDCEHRIAV